MEAYKKALLYIIELNLAGTPLVEGYACILLSRILTPFCHRLRRPAIPHRRGDQRGRLRFQRRCLSVVTKPGCWPRWETAGFTWAM